MPHAVTWFEISSNDPNNLAAFYKKAFRWKVESQNGMEFIPSQKDGAQQGIAGSFADARGGPGGVTVYVTCPDIDAQMEKVRAAGGSPVMPKFDLPGDAGSLAAFSDPDGNRIGLWAPAAKQQAAKKDGKKAGKKAAKKAGKKAAKKAGAAQQATTAAAPAPAAKKAPKKKAKKKAGGAAQVEPAAAQASAPAAKKAPKKKGKKKAKA